MSRRKRTKWWSDPLDPIILRGHGDVFRFTPEPSVQTLAREVKHLIMTCRHRARPALAQQAASIILLGGGKASLDAWWDAVPK